METSTQPQEFQINSLQLSVQVKHGGFCDVVITDTNTMREVSKNNLSLHTYNCLLDFLNVHDHPHLLGTVKSQFEFQCNGGAQ